MKTRLMARVLGIGSAMRAITVLRRHFVNGCFFVFLQESAFSGHRVLQKPYIYNGLLTL